MSKKAIFNADILKESGKDLKKRKLDSRIWIDGVNMGRFITVDIGLINF